MDELLKSVFYVVGGVFVLFIVVPMFIAVVVKTGVYAYFKGKRRFEREQNKVDPDRPWMKGKSNGT